MNENNKLQTIENLKSKRGVSIDKYKEYLTFFRELHIETKKQMQQIDERLPKYAVEFVYFLIQREYNLNASHRLLKFNLSCAFLKQKRPDAIKELFKDVFDEKNIFENAINKQCFVDDVRGFMIDKQPLIIRLDGFLSSKNERTLSYLEDMRLKELEEVIKEKIEKKIQLEVPGYYNKGDEAYIYAKSAFYIIYHMIAMNELKEGLAEVLELSCWANIINSDNVNIFAEQLCPIGEEDFFALDKQQRLILVGIMPEIVLEEPKKKRNFLSKIKIW